MLYEALKQQCWLVASKSNSKKQRKIKYRIVVATKQHDKLEAISIYIVESTGVTCNLALVRSLSYQTKSYAFGRAIHHHNCHTSNTSNTGRKTS